MDKEKKRAVAAAARAEKAAEKARVEMERALAQKEEARIKVEATKAKAKALKERTKLEKERLKALEQAEKAREDLAKVRENAAQGARKTQTQMPILAARKIPSQVPLLVSEWNPYAVGLYDEGEGGKVKKTGGKKREETTVFSENPLAVSVYDPAVAAAARAEKAAEKARVEMERAIALKEEARIKVEATKAKAKALKERTKLEKERIKALEQAEKAREDLAKARENAGQGGRKTQPQMPIFAARKIPAQVPLLVSEYYQEQAALAKKKTGGKKLTDFNNMPGALASYIPNEVVKSPKTAKKRALPSAEAKIPTGNFLNDQEGPTKAKKINTGKKSAKTATSAASSALGVNPQQPMGMNQMGMQLQGPGFQMQLQMVSTQVDMQAMESKAPKSQKARKKKE